MLEPIFHVTTAGEWQAALAHGAYTTPSLGEEGFIHASTAAQVPATAVRYYTGVADLVLLVIDPDAVTAEIRWEESRGEAFPHLYGTLDLDAVRRVVPFGPGPGGDYQLPAGAGGAV